MTAPAMNTIALIVTAMASTIAPEDRDDDAFPPSEEQREAIDAKRAALDEAIDGLGDDRPEDLIADVAIFRKAADWIVRHDEFFEEGSAAWTIEALDRGLERAGAIRDGRSPWETTVGGVVRGFRSKVDGSIQPYAVVRPEGLDRSARVRLDVVLHGRNARLNEVRFIRDLDGKAAPEGLRDRIVLHVFGRGNNAYRWAGETDVFEAIEAVKRTELIDPERIVLRGFSMGGAGAWHLGLHHPSDWAAVEAGAGFSETIRYAKLGEIPPDQRDLLHIYDARDYALNAFDVPIVGYGGEVDPQLQASENILERLRSLGFETSTEGLETRVEGLELLRVVGAGMGHKVDPSSRETIETFLKPFADRGVEVDRPRVRFVTYTLKYPRAAWIEARELRAHYQRALIDARVDPESPGTLHVATENVAVLAIERQVADTAVIDGSTLPLREAVGGYLPHVVYRRSGDAWITLDYDQSRAIALGLDGRKHPGLQGPIDDAFTAPFLCVRGTGTPWNPLVAEWSEKRMQRFAADWDKWMRGRLPIKDDVDITAKDHRDAHLILFGDPGSNRLLDELLPALPLSWSRDRVGIIDGADASNHAPVLIALNPLSPGRYVVVNSGHTFGSDAFRGTNALLYPRLGDHALFRITEVGEEVVQSGFFDEAWRARRGDGP